MEEKKEGDRGSLASKTAFTLLHSIYAFIYCYMVRVRQKYSMGFGSFMLLVLDGYMVWDRS